MTRRQYVNLAGDLGVLVGYGLVIGGIWTWSQPLALVVGGVLLMGLGYLAAVK